LSTNVVVGNETAAV